MDIQFTPDMFWKVANGRKTATRRFSAVYKPGQVLRCITQWQPVGDWGLVPSRDIPRHAAVFIPQSGAQCDGRPRPARHMPKWLRERMPVIGVLSVERQRLNDITEDEAIAEGIDAPPGMAVREFSNLWAAIHGADSWKRNGLVFVVKFELVSKGQI